MDTVLVVSHFRTITVLLRAFLPSHSGPRVFSFSTIDILNLMILCWRQVEGCSVFESCLAASLTST